MSSVDGGSWLELAETEISARNLNPELLDVLRAFGGDDAPGPASLDPDAAEQTTKVPADAAEQTTKVSADAAEQTTKVSADAAEQTTKESADASSSSDANSDLLPTLISTTLSTEVDSDQASMFARRFVAVSTMLRQQNTPTSNLLRLGLNRRAYQILEVNDPTKPGRALRIRALVDFIWSQSLVLGIQEDESKKSLPTLKRIVERGIEYHEFAPGMRHGLIEGETSDFGPAHINVLRIAKGAATMRCVDARAEGSTCLETLADKCNAAAAISGGFFLYSEPDIEPPSKRTDPVGLLVRDDEVINPPVLKRGALLQDGKSNDIFIQKLGMDGVTCLVHASSSDEGFETLPMTVGKNCIRCVHRGQCKKVVIRAEHIGISIVGKKVHEVKRGKHELIGKVEMDVPLAGFVLIQEVMPLLLRNIVIKPGDAVEYSFGELEGCSNIRAGMAGGPILLSEGGVIECASELPKEDFCGSAPPVTFSQDETFDRNLLPRMGAGVTTNGELVCAAIDGRNLDKALGLTLKGTAELLSALGCVRGLNLDGGSSKRMVIKDKGIVCLHTTEIKSKAADREKEEDSQEKTGTHEADGRVSENLDAHEEKKEATPELSRPVHSAILFLPREASRKRKADED